MVSAKVQDGTGVKYHLELAQDYITNEQRQC